MALDRLREVFSLPRATISQIVLDRFREASFRVDTGYRKWPPLVVVFGARGPIGTKNVFGAFSP
jgi:hypothetical protein